MLPPDATALQESPSSSNAYYPPLSPYGQITAPEYSFLQMYDIT